MLGWLIAGLLASAALLKSLWSLWRERYPLERGMTSMATPIAPLSVRWPRSSPTETDASDHASTHPTGCYGLR
jgi:hypothetical protein